MPNLTCRAESIDGKLAELLAVAEKLRAGATVDPLDVHALYVDLTEAVADLRNGGAR
jgi:hypothetical protein